LWQTPLESDYTIVSWDQRGAGNTYYKNNGNNGEITHEQMLSDIDEIVDYLQEKFMQEKIVIMGHSWGTDIGIRYALRHPEKVSHYVGVGQVVSTHELVDEQVREAARIARADGNEAVAQDMEQQWIRLKEVAAAMPQSAPWEEYEAFETDLSTLWQSVYSYVPQGPKTSTIKEVARGFFSPRLTWSDVKWLVLGGMISEGYRGMMPLLYEHEVLNCSLYNEPLTFDVPITFITGENDWVTPYTLVEEYLQKIDAPSKEVIYIENAGHAAMYDNSDKFVEVVAKALATGNLQ
jgi:pimeloyl-ACP methyl ester carboxylesterase